MGAIDLGDTAFLGLSFAHTRPAIGEVARPLRPRRVSCHFLDPPILFQPDFVFLFVLNSFLQQPGLPFADVLPEDRRSLAAFDEQGVAFAQEEDEIYTPQLTLWAFLSQVLF